MGTVGSGTFEVLRRNQAEIKRRAGRGIEITMVADLDVARRDVAIASVAVKELNQLVSEIDQAIKDLAPTEAKVDGDIPASIRASINVEERNLDLLEAQMAPLALVAPFDGIVSLVRRHAGETVQPGEAIMTVSKERASRVLAFVRQPLNIEARLGMKIEVRARSGHRPAGFGEVVSVGSQLEAVIPTLLPRTSSAGNSGTSELGLPLLVSLPADLPVHPGELVELRTVER
jgi:multidrug resistance efflux pump